MELIFLSAKDALVKQISKDKTTPYPLAKSFTSEHYEIEKSAEGLEEFERLIVAEASKGRCLHKGKLTRKLKNESRAGIADRNALTDLLVFDLDGIELPGVNIRGSITSHDIHNISEQFVALLPAEFQNVSYITQASASLGLKGNKISLHMFFVLKNGVYPRALKNWLKTLNYEIDLLADQLTLSANGHSLRYPLDTSVADNSKLIYIAAPKFVGVQDPIDGNRIVRITRGEPTVDINSLISDVNREKINTIENKIKDGLRSKIGLRKKPTKTTNITINDEFVELLQNPDKMNIQVSRISEPYVNCNVNGGDSGGYYFLITNPYYMYNFKGEPIWEIEKADPEFYRYVFDNILKDEGSPAKPVVLRDFFTDTYYNGLYDKTKQQFTDEFPLTPTNKTSLEGFMRTHNGPMPDFVPDARVVFDPSAKEGINLDKAPYFVNMYRRTSYMLKPDEITETSYGEAFERLIVSCPNISKLIKHVLGDGEIEFEHFVNWLAYIYQEKQKSMTAWIFTGVPGTGKGVLVQKVLKPLFGEQQVPMRSLENIEEQFNLYMRTALFLVVDEFRMGDSGNIGKMADKLKHQITEPTLTIRAMRTNQIELPSFCNFIFLTNRADAVRIEEGDRRYNVAPRQERKLEVVHPELINNINELRNELYTFSGTLQSFAVDARMAHTVLENNAKKEMRQVSMSVLEEYANAIKTQNLQYFTEVLDIPLANTFDAGSISIAQRYVKDWISKVGEESVIPMQHFKLVYDVLTDSKNRMSARDFSKAMSRHNVSTGRKRIGTSKAASAPRGVILVWYLPDDQKDVLIETHFDQKDKTALVN
jgi:hypothetical protein